jgi:hypothetical protein
MACGVAMDSLLRDQAESKSSGRHRQAKAKRDVARAAAPQAATAEATAPSGQAVMAGNTKSWLQWLS